MRGPIESVAMHGSVSTHGYPAAQACLVVSTVMGACIVPVYRSAHLGDTFRALEDSLGMSQQ
jgi:hypothetical protein